MSLHGPPLRVDLVIFGLREESLQVLLWRRGDAPYRGRWTLPGGFVREAEPVEEAARRVLREKTGFDEEVYIEQLYTFCEPGMDPRGPLVSATYFVVVSPEQTSPDGTFHPAKDAPALAFHHDQVLRKGVERLRTKAEYSTVPLRFLEEPFTLSDVQAVYEALLDRALDKRNFRRKILALDALTEVEGRRRVGAHRPARLFELKERTAYLLKERGILFPF
ncbi:MAG: NUDIX domain-containing protein [Planctomycetota bacterium]